MTLLTTTEEIAELCEELAHEPFVALDTEFMRDRTYWPKLCLVQIAGQNRFAAIDPMAPGIDLAPLFALMANPAVVKVFHACRQDVEIFYHLSGAIPTPLFDTQLAAMVCGYGEEVGYETLVTRVAKARIDKSSRFTDWSRRPLSPQQLDYALGDVTHLRVIYQKLEAQLRQTGRTGWVAQELAGLTDPNTYEQPPEDAWRRIKVRSRDSRFLAIVRALAAWREQEAQRRDLPRNRVLRDDLLLELAASRPRSAEDIAKLRRVSLDRASITSAMAAVRSRARPAGIRAAGGRAAAQAAARHRPAGRSPARAAQIPVRGASRRPTAGGDHRRPRGDCRLRRARRPGAAGLAAGGVRPLGADPQARQGRPRGQQGPGGGGADGGRDRAGVAPMPDGRILLVGHHSFLAQHALGALGQVKAVGHEAIDQPDLLDGVGCVINFARHPLAGSDAYRLETHGRRSAAGSPDRQRARSPT